MSSDTRFRRVKKPNTPIKKSIADSISRYSAGMFMIVYKLKCEN